MWDRMPFYMPHTTNLINDGIGNLYMLKFLDLLDLVKCWPDKSSIKIGEIKGGRSDNGKESKTY